METPSGKLECVTTYLEMTEPPTSPTPPRPASKLALLHAESPTVAFYRFLYNNVGARWLWYERRTMDDGTLEAIIQNPEVEIYVLHVHGVPAGFGELDLRKKPDIKLAYFGLMPEFIGRGFGRYLLRWTVDQAWMRHPKRLWTHTCNFDHPRVLGLYQRMGFVAYRQKTTVIDDPRPTVTLP